MWVFTGVWGREQVQCVVRCAPHACDCQRVINTSLLYPSPPHHPHIPLLTIPPSPSSPSPHPPPSPPPHHSHIPPPSPLLTIPTSSPDMSETSPAELSNLEKCLSVIIDSLKQQNATLVKAVSDLVSELCRITLLWDEMWMAALMQRQGDVQR